MFLPSEQVTLRLWFSAATTFAAGHTRVLPSLQENTRPPSEVGVGSLTIGQTICPLSGWGDAAVASFEERRVVVLVEVVAQDAIRNVTHVNIDAILANLFISNSPPPLVATRGMFPILILRIWESPKLYSLQSETLTV